MWIGDRVQAPGPGPGPQLPGPGSRPGPPGWGVGASPGPTYPILSYPILPYGPHGSKICPHGIVQKYVLTGLSKICPHPIVQHSPKINLGIHYGLWA